MCSLVKNPSRDRLKELSYSSQNPLIRNSMICWNAFVSSCKSALHNTSLRKTVMKLLVTGLRLKGSRSTWSPWLGQGSITNSQRWLHTLASRCGSRKTFRLGKVLLGSESRRCFHVRSIVSLSWNSAVTCRTQECISNRSGYASSPLWP